MPSPSSLTCTPLRPNVRIATLSSSPARPGPGPSTVPGGRPARGPRGGSGPAVTSAGSRRWRVSRGQATDPHRGAATGQGGGGPWGTTSGSTWAWRPSPPRPCGTAASPWCRCPTTAPCSRPTCSSRATRSPSASGRARSSTPTASSPSSSPTWAPPRRSTCRADGGRSSTSPRSCCATCSTASAPRTATTSTRSWWPTRRRGVRSASPRWPRRPAGPARPTSCPSPRSRPSPCAPRPSLDLAEGDRVLVADYGGGGFQAAVLGAPRLPVRDGRSARRRRPASAGSTSTTPSSRTSCGPWATRSPASTRPSPPTAGPSPRCASAASTPRSACRELDAVEIDVSLRGTRSVVRLDGPRLDELAAPVVRRTLGPLRDLLAATGTDAADAAGRPARRRRLDARDRPRPGRGGASARRSRSTRTPSGRPRSGSAISVGARAAPEPERRPAAANELVPDGVDARLLGLPVDRPTHERPDADGASAVRRARRSPSPAGRRRADDRGRPRRGPAPTGRGRPRRSTTTSEHLLPRAPPRPDPVAVPRLPARRGGGRRCADPARARLRRRPRAAAHAPSHHRGRVGHDDAAPHGGRRVGRPRARRRSTPPAPASPRSPVRSTTSASPSRSRAGAAPARLAFLRLDQGDGPVLEPDVARRGRARSGSRRRSSTSARSAESAVGGLAGDGRRAARRRHRRRRAAHARRDAVRDARRQRRPRGRVGVARRAGHRRGRQPRRPRRLRGQRPAPRRRRRDVARPGGVVLYRHDDAVAQAVEAGLPRRDRRRVPRRARSTSCPCRRARSASTSPAAVVADLQAPPRRARRRARHRPDGDRHPRGARGGRPRGQVQLLSQAGGALNAAYVAAGRQAADVVVPDRRARLPARRRGRPGARRRAAGAAAEHAVPAAHPHARDDRRRRPRRRMAGSVRASRTGSGHSGACDGAHHPPPRRAAAGGRRPRVARRGPRRRRLPGRRRAHHGPVPGAAPGPSHPARGRGRASARPRWPGRSPASTTPS